MRLFSSLLLICLALISKGQGLFDRYTVESGLSQNSILSILQDKRGYLWLGTEDGLNRFDGYTFKKFFHDPLDSLSLPSDQVWALTEDDQDRIWVGHTKGISFFDYHTHQFSDLLKEDDLFISTVYKDQKGNLWFGTTESGLIFINISTLEIQRFTNKAKTDPRFDSSAWSISSNYITAITEYEGGLIIGTRGAGFWNFSKGEFKRLHGTKFNNDFFNINAVWSFAYDQNGNLYVATLKGLCVFEQTAIRVLAPGNLPNLPGHAPLTRLCFNKNKTGLWIASYGDGLLYYDINSGNFTQYRNEVNNLNSLSGNLIYSLLLDDFDNLWVGTWGSGLNKLQNRAKFFKTYNTNDGFGDNFITAIDKVDERTVLVSSYTGGIYEGRFDGKNEKFVFGKILSSEDINQHYIRTVIHDAKMIYAGLDGGGVAYRERKNGSEWKYYRKIRSNANSLNYLLVESLYKDKYENLWVGTWGGGLKKINTRVPYGSVGCVQNITLRGDEQGLNIFSIYEDKDGYLWVGSAQGVFRSHFPLEDSNNISFKEYGESLAHCFLQVDDKIWIGTDHGLFFSNGEVLEYEPALGANTINSIVADSTGGLWVTTNAGLYVVKNKSIQHFTANDGLQSNEFNAGVGLILGSQVLIGGIHGMNSFNPYNLKSDASLGRVAVTKVVVNNKKILNDPTGIEMDHEDKVIEFEFTSFDFTNPSSNKFAYKLDGFDDEWVEVMAPTRTATYTNLDAGKYSFKVKANVVNGSSYEIPLLINPPIWETWWAYCLYGLSFVAIVFVWRKNIVNRERLKTKLATEHIELDKLKELDDFKSRFFANISHEFRTPLTLILGHADELLDRSNDAGKSALQTIRQNGHTALNLVNQLLDLSKIDAGKLNLLLKRVPVVRFIREHVEMFQSLASQKDIILEAKYPEEEVDIFLDPTILEKVIINLISNAIKYSSPGDSISVHTSMEGSRLLIKVSDTGIGISEENQKLIFNRFFRVSESGEGTGIGLSLTKELVALHKGRIKVKSEEGKGTSFEVEIPTDRDDYPEANYPITDLEISNKVSELVGESVYENFEAEVNNEAPTLLIVEDNTELQSYLKRNLESEYKLIICDDGEDGLVKSNLNVPDIILSDWMMPGMNGAEMCGKLKNGEVTSHIPVVLLTAKADLDSKIQGLEIGADDYVTKPFDMKELKARLRNLIVQRERLRAKYASMIVNGYKQVQALSIDEVFLNKFYDIIEGNLSSPKMTVEWLSREMGVSRVQLHRKLTALLGQSASEIIKDYKLNRAADLLRQNAGNVSEVAYRVGFENLSYFTKVFKQKYSVTPSEFS